MSVVISSLSDGITDSDDDTQGAGDDGAVYDDYAIPGDAGAEPETATGYDDTSVEMTDVTGQSAQDSGYYGGGSGGGGGGSDAGYPAATQCPTGYYLGPNGCIVNPATPATMLTPATVLGPATPVTTTPATLPVFTLPESSAPKSPVTIAPAKLNLPSKARPAAKACGPVGAVCPRATCCTGLVCTGGRCRGKATAAAPKKPAKPGQSGNAPRNVHGLEDHMIYGMDLGDIINDLDGLSAAEDDFLTGGGAPIYGDSSISTEGQIPGYGMDEGGGYVDDSAGAGMDPGAGGGGYDDGSGMMPSPGLPGDPYGGGAASGGYAPQGYPQGGGYDPYGQGGGYPQQGGYGYPQQTPYGYPQSPYGQDPYAQQAAGLFPAGTPQIIIDTATAITNGSATLQMVQQAVATAQSMGFLAVAQQLISMYQAAGGVYTAAGTATTGTQTTGTQTTAAAAALARPGAVTYKPSDIPAAAKQAGIDIRNGTATKSEVLAGMAALVTAGMNTQAINLAVAWNRTARGKADPITPSKSGTGVVMPNATGIPAANGGWPTTVPMAPGWTTGKYGCPILKAHFWTKLTFVHAGQPTAGETTMFTARAAGAFTHVMMVRRAAGGSIAPDCSTLKTNGGAAFVNSAVNSGNVATYKLS